MSARDPIPGIPKRPPRVVLEAVSPVVDAGRHPAKRIEGDLLTIEADAFKDGHDRIDGCVRLRAPGERRARTLPLVHDFPPDRWHASVRLDRIGRWRFRVEVWPDHWRTWRDELRKRVDAGQEADVAAELLEAADLLRRVAKGRARGADALLDAATDLEDTTVPPLERAEWILEAENETLLEGPLDPEERVRSAEYEVQVDRPIGAVGAWYELFPRSQGPLPTGGDAPRHGTFADVERRLPELADLGFDVLYLPPIHPIGRTARKGRNNAEACEPGDPGSPWAIGAAEGGHTAVHPELGTLADFERLVRAAREHDIEIALDFALQCAPDHPWVQEHPDWFRVRRDGTIRYAENPPKKYQDIVPLEFWCEDREAMWQACADVLLFWIERGVKIFRVDNPHTKPLAFWEWAIRTVQERHPDVVFLSESFTRPKRMKGLAKLGFTQSYTYFTWKNTSWELRDYLTELTRTEMAEYFRPNFFANTPDILHEYLQRGGRPAFRVRLLLAATLAPSYGIYSGFELCENQPVRPGSEEYLDSEKYQIKPRDWDAPGHLKDDVRRLNRLRREHPALRRLTNLVFLESSNEQILPFWKSAPGDDLLVVANLDAIGPQDGTVRVPLDALGLRRDRPFRVRDLLTGETWPWQGEWNYVRLDPSDRPGHVFQVLREDAA
jgi:starch synthase (maltosyl-transferring)